MMGRVPRNSTIRLADGQIQADSSMLEQILNCSASNHLYTYRTHMKTAEPRSDADAVMHQSIESPGGGGREMAGRCRAYPV